MSGKTARDLIAEVVAAHQQADEYGYPIEECRCGESFPQDYADHVAGEIDAALGGLTREWGVVIDYPPRLDDNYPGAVVTLDTYKLREAAEIVKRTKYPEDCYEVRPRWVSGWNEAPQ